ncbi:MAG: hypothetical protein U1A77_21615 [Pirellulales bacterium]
MKYLLQFAWAFACVAAAMISPVRAWEKPSIEPEFPLSLKIIDPDSEKKNPPYIIMFEKGLDKKGVDVSSPLWRLKALRGDSKMFPEMNKDPGLPVVLRGLRFHRQMKEDGSVAGYEVELQGEFNMVRVPVDTEMFEKFLAGEPVTLMLKGDSNYGLYSYVSTIHMKAQLKGKEIQIFNVSGDFTFREGFRRYTSSTKKISPPEGRSHVFRGEVGELPDLPAI